MYDRAIRVRQCHNCQKYGHIGATCPNQSPTCVHCAGEHLSQKCSTKADGTLKENKCANCGSTHAAWANDYPDRVREVEKMKEMARYRPRYHPVPAHFSAKAPSPVLQPSPASSWGTPAGHSSSSEGSGTESSDSTTAERAAQIGYSTSLQSSQWAKTGKEGASTQSGAMVSRSGLQRRQPVISEPIVSMNTAEDSIYPIEDATQASQLDGASQSPLHAGGISFEPAISTRAAKATKKQKSKTKSVSTASVSSRKSQRLVELTERAAEAVVSLPDIPTSELAQDASYKPSTAGSSALTEISDKIFNSYNPRKRRHTETETTDVRFEPRLRRNTRHSAKPTKSISSQ
ncbi:hypothetical protein ACN38_g12980 [Penicillium nordicum]|uniref:CCHC-type domain-containing protein n=1 Tax=Penicillium nordicum TaxID=229535 RepID=A0A0M8NPV2_9EURO|nr:hypothetical protein ACN38_g12980 [Penicillium nordicum]